jgi:N-acetylglucosaminyldiphosphoundecaprenol N-acetyl-beta-D-mannosaminyltransferase
MAEQINNKSQEMILGYPISTLSMDACLQSIHTWIESNSRAAYFVCANPHSIIQGKNDCEFQQAMRHADLVSPDGSGIAIASKILGGSVRGRVTGSDIFLGLSMLLNKSGGRSYFFLGSTDETLAAIKKKMALEFPNIRFAGAYSPPFKPTFSDEESRAMIDAVNVAQPDVLWVGMTAPKQEKWIYQNRDRLNVKFIGAVGAVFDFYVGNVKRSHPFFQKIGLEWLPRLLQEPRRLWQRMFVSAPIFMLHVLREAHRLRRRKAQQHH